MVRMNRHGPNHIRISLTHCAPTRYNSGERYVEIEAEHADGGEAVLRVRFTPEQFAELMASKSIVVRSDTPVPGAPAYTPAPCASPSPDTYGDCDGRVREYRVLRDMVWGKIRDDRIDLCLHHARHHGTKVQAVQG